MTFNEEILLQWCENATADKDLIPELIGIKSDMEKFEDAFFRELEFGTGGLRGKIGAGTNRMNVYTIARATAGLANYLSSTYNGRIQVAIGYDTRIKSQLFAKTAAEVLASKGIYVHMFNRHLPTPVLSFAVRELACQAGIMITASHNPAIYNGYKVYGADGCQITTEAADAIYGEIAKLDYFSNIPTGKSNGQIAEIPEEVYQNYLSAVRTLSMTEDVDKEISVVYTPLNGTGMEPVMDILTQSGYNHITVVTEQASPDGTFPTCPFPNPELEEAMQLGLGYAKNYNADILLATDPDCDRVGVAVKNNLDYQLLTGNEVGILLLDYICSQKRNMPENPLCIKTIVTTDLAEKIAGVYGVSVVNVLTGFKFIGEKIGVLEKKGEKQRYLFGFEESCGYLSGTHARDKDGVNAALLICEMCGYYKKKNITLKERLNELYRTYGYSFGTLLSYNFEGESGMKIMQNFMSSIRKPKEKIGSFSILKSIDYLVGIDGLPKADVMKLIFKESCSLVIRPSGTEPKLKFYLFVNAETEQMARRILEELKQCVDSYVGENSR